MRRSWVVVAAACAAALLAGCGSGSSSTNDTPPPSITAGSGTISSPSGSDATKAFVDRIFAAVGAARSFHVVGSGKQGGTSYQLDIHFGPDGAAGSLTEGGQGFDLVAASGMTYIKASAATWQATLGARPDAPALAARLAGHWVMAPSSDKDFAQLSQYLDKDRFVQSFSGSASADAGPFEKVGPATVNGTAATEYVDTKDQSKIYVAAHGAPRLLKVDGSAGGDGGGLTITDYDEPFRPSVPDNALDYTKIVTQ